MTFAEEVTLSIINKIGIGAIVGLCGFILNLLLEKYKTTQAVREEVAKLSINKISEIWDGLEKIHVELVQIGLEIIDIKYRDKIQSKALESITKKTEEIFTKKIIPNILRISEETIPSMRYKIHSYRFWLGKKLVEEQIR